VAAIAMAVSVLMEVLQVFSNIAVFNLKALAGLYTALPLVLIFLLFLMSTLQEYISPQL
jgi:hypothetical protein